MQPLKTMIFSAFSTLTIAYVTVDGQSYIDIVTPDQTSLNVVLNEGIKGFCKETKCLYDDRIVFTLTPSTALYDSRGSALSRACCEVDYIMVNNYRLARTDVQTLNSSFYAQYRDQNAAQPIMYAELPLSNILLVPTPDQVYTKTYVAGWYVPPTLTANDTVPLLEEDLRLAAKYCAVLLIGPYASGVSLQRKLELEAELSREMPDRVITPASRKLQGPDVRGAGRRSIRSTRTVW